MNQSAEFLAVTTRTVNASPKLATYVSEPTSLQELLDRTVHSFELECARRQIVFQAKFDTTEHLRCPMPREVKTAVVCLLNTAMASASPGDQIVLSTRHADNFAAIEVTDTGHGLSELDLTLIQEGRLDEVPGRAGANLRVANAIVANCDGHIEVDSLQDVGTMVALWWRHAPHQCHTKPIDRQVEAIFNRAGAKNRLSLGCQPPMSPRASARCSS